MSISVVGIRKKLRRVSSVGSHLRVKGRWMLLSGLLSLPRSVRNGQDYKRLAERGGQSHESPVENVLGYVTLNFPPTMGKSVKIELIGNANNRDAFGNIIEIPGTPDTQSSAGKGGGKNTLGIVETEIFEPLKPLSKIKLTVRIPAYKSCQISKH
jgi:hypothetical protein